MKRRKGSTEATRTQSYLDASVNNKFARTVLTGRRPGAPRHPAMQNIHDRRRQVKEARDARLGIGAVRMGHLGDRAEALEEGQRDLRSYEFWRGPSGRLSMREWFSDQGLDVNDRDDRQSIKEVRRRMRMARAHRSRTARRSRLGLHKGGPVKYLAKGSEDDFKDVEMGRAQRVGGDYTALDWALDIARNMSTYAASKFLHAFGASPKTGGKVFGVDLKEQAELMRKQPGGLLNPRALERLSLIHI